MSELTTDQVAYCHERAAARREIWAGHRECRDATIEECAANLAAWYPDNVSTNAFCAALRSMKNGPALLTASASALPDDRSVSTRMLGCGEP